jgi:hypothetical protein
LKDIYIDALRGKLQVRIKLLGIYAFSFRVNRGGNVAADVEPSLDKLWVIPKGLCDLRVNTLLFSRLRSTHLSPG